MSRQFRPIGEIFVGMGRITPDDVQRALAHQREQGGYFGDALVALGMLSRDEVRWGLADQHDLPFVQIQPDSIDREAARLVPAAWARQHRILPVLRYADSVTVVLSDPNLVTRFEDVCRFTGAERVEAALCAPETLDSLLEAVFGAGDDSAVSLDDWLREALGTGVLELGVSVWGEQTLGWYRSEPVTTRRLEPGAWHALRGRLTTPPLGGPGLRRWPALLSTPLGTWQADCQLAAAGERAEFAARLGVAVEPALCAGLEPALRDELEAAVRSGGLLLRARSHDAPELLELALAALPTLLGAGELRAVHLHAREVAFPPHVLALRAEPVLDASFAALGAFAFDLLTLDVPGLDAAALDAARRVAPVVAATAESLPAGATVDLELVLQRDRARLLWTHR